MKSSTSGSPMAIARAPRHKSGALQLKPVDGITFVDRGVGGTPLPGALARLQDFWTKYPRRKLRNGEKGAAQLLKAARDRR